MSDTVIEFRNVGWQYADTKSPAVSHVNIKVKKGEFIGIIGVNNSGKSTLCRICNGLIPHSFSGEFTGDILLENRSIKDMETARLAEKVGSVFSDPEAQLSQITVFDELAFGPSNLGIPKAEIFDRVKQILKLMDLDSMSSRSPFQLSGGEQQRVAIASVLSMNPDILVLDEPTSNLDPISTERIFDVISALNQQEGITVLLVEHEIELLARYASRIIVMDQGNVLLDGTAREVFACKKVFEQIGIHIPQVTQISSIAKDTYKLWADQVDPLTLDEMFELLEHI